MTYDEIKKTLPPGQYTIAKVFGYLEVVVHTTYIQGMVPGNIINSHNSQRTALIDNGRWRFYRLGLDEVRYRGVV